MTPSGHCRVGRDEGNTLGPVLVDGSAVEMIGSGNDTAVNLCVGWIVDGDEEGLGVGILLGTELCVVGTLLVSFDGFDETERVGCKDGTTLGSNDWTVGL